MPPRYQSRPTDLLTRVRNEMDALGRPGMAGLSRLGGNRGRGFGQASVVADGTQENGQESPGSPQQLVLSVTSDSIASGGDHVAFDQVLDQHGFEGVAPTSGGYWVHPVSAPYIVTYEHIWGDFDGEATVHVELDGEVSTARTIGSGSGSKGRGTIQYWANAGQVGRIKVTHSDGSAQDCSATMWLSMPDPGDAAAAPGSANVQLYIDDVLVASASGDVGVAFSSASVLLGELSGGAVSASEFAYDEVELVHDGANLLGNSGFESALAGTGNVATIPVTTGNWYGYVQNDVTTTRVTSPVHAGTYAGEVDVAGGSGPNGGYFVQDVDIAPGDPFDLDVQVYPTSGSQKLAVLFDWSRPGSHSHSAQVAITPTETSFSAFGLSGSGPALPYGEWSKVTLRIGVVG